MLLVVSTCSSVLSHTSGCTAVVTRCSDKAAEPAWAANVHSPAFLLCLMDCNRRNTQTCRCTCHPVHTGAITDHVQALLSRGQAAIEAIASGAPDTSSRKDADAFKQLQLIRQMVELAGQRQWDRLLQVCGCCFHPALWYTVVLGNAAPPVRIIEYLVTGWVLQSTACCV